MLGRYTSNIMFGWGAYTKGANIYKYRALDGCMELEIKNTTEADKTYDYAKVIERKLKHLDELNTSKKNKELIKKFLQNCINESLSNARISLYIDKLIVLTSMTKKDFDMWDKVDVESVISEISKKYESVETRRIYIVTIKKFFRYLKDEDNPDIIKWIKTKNYQKTAKKNNEQEKEENILQPEEIERMSESAKHPRDKAFVLLLYYSGCRIGELLVLKIKDIIFEDKFTSISVSGKTGYRKVPVTECTSVLKTWLEYHPDKNNKDAYVWVSLQDLNRINNLKQFTNNQKTRRKNKINIDSNNHIKVSNVAKLLRELRDRVNINKKVNPHNFRHSRLTALGIYGLERDMLKKFAGHSKKSNVTSQYTHYTDNDLKNSLGAIQGLEGVEVKKPEMKRCFRCSHLNRSTLTICENCGLTLDFKEGANIDGKKIKEVKLTKIMKMLTEDPLFQKVLARYFLDKGMGNYVKELAEDEK
jgi:integrase